MYITLSVGIGVIPHFGETDAKKKYRRKKKQEKKKYGGKVHWDSWKYYIWSQTNNNNIIIIIIIFIRRAYSASVGPLFWFCHSRNEQLRKKHCNQKPLTLPDAPSGFWSREQKTNESQYKHTHRHTHGTKETTEKCRHAFKIFSLSRASYNNIQSNQRRTGLRHNKQINTENKKN